jgi:hypothetical protein
VFCIYAGVEVVNNEYMCNEYNNKGYKEYKEIDMLQTCASIGKENHTDEFKDQFQVTLELQIRFKGLFFPVCFDIMESYILYKGAEGKRKTTKCNVDVDAVPAHVSQPK